MTIQWKISGRHNPLKKEFHIKVGGKKLVLFLGFSVRLLLLLLFGAIFWAEGLARENDHFVNHLCAYSAYISIQGRGYTLSPLYSGQKRKINFFEMLLYFWYAQR